MLSDKGIYVLGCYVMNKARASIQICFTYAVLSASCVDPFVLSYLLAGSSKFTSDQFCPLEKAEANCKHFCFFLRYCGQTFFFFFVKHFITYRGKTPCSCSVIQIRMAALPEHTHCHSSFYMRTVPCSLVTDWSCDLAL